MKRICSIILVLCICMATMPVLAVKGDLDSAVFEVTSLGIFEGDGNGDLKLENTMTRAEFAKVVVVLTGMKDAISGGKSPMKDVPADHWASGYIKYLIDTGMMSGYPDGTFRPEATITLDECIKTILVVMGYEIVAENRGGYPDGYYSVAVQKDMVLGVKGGRKNAALRKDVILIINNALDVPNVVNTVSNSVKYYEDPSITIRNTILKLDDIDSITGVVTATSDIWLNAPNSSMEKGQIEIDGLLYDVDANILDSANKYIGQEVIAYYTFNDSMAYPVIHNIQSTVHNTVTEIRVEDKENFTDGEIKYKLPGSDRKTEIKLYDETRYIYNGRPETRLTDDFKNIKCGSYVVINNDLDNAPEYVLANEYKNYVIEKANRNGNLRLKFLNLVEGDTVVDSKSLFLKLDDENAFTIKDSYGRTISYDSLSEGMVVSVYENLLDNFKTIVVSDKEFFTAKLTSKESDNNQVYIDDELYTLDSDIMYSFVRLGEYYDFYPDAEGRIAFVEISEEKSSWKYGYIYDIGSFGRTTEVMLIDAGKVVNRAEQNYADVTQTGSTATTFQNDAILYLTVADRVKIDGKNFDSDEIYTVKEQAIKYALNDKGELRYIETLTAFSGSSKTQYKASESVFIDNAAPNANEFGDFIINTDTKVICLPKNSGADEDDLLLQIDSGELITNAAYAYDRNDENNAAKLITIEVDMDADEIVPYIPTSSAKVGLVGDVKHTFDQDDNEFVKITLATHGEVKTLTSLSLESRPVLNDLRKGDIIFYKEDADGRLDKVAIAGNIKDLMADVETVSGSGYEITVGYASAIRMNEVQHEKGRRVHKLDITAINKLYTKYIHIRNYPQVLIYDTETNSVSMGTIDDIVAYPTPVEDLEKLIILEDGNETMRAIVIVR